MKKQLTLFLVTLLVVVLGLGVFTACDSDKTPKAETPVIATNTKTVELGDDDDLVYNVDWKNGTLTEVKKGQIALTSANYVVGEDSLTVKGDYVAALAEGTHTFTLVTDGGSAEFKIIVNDSRPVNPTVTADKQGSFNTLDPDALVTYTVNWGKGTFVSLKVGDETLEKDTDYTVEGNTLSIVGQGLIDSWDADTYTFTLTTTTGSATFDLTVVMSGSRYLDEKVFKVADGGDVSFAMLIGTNTQISSVKSGATTLETNAYSYDLASESFTLKTDYLATLGAGIHDFTIALDDTTTYSVSVATGTVLADNFENGNTNGLQMAFNAELTTSNVSDSDAISGKSVKVDCIPGFATTFVTINNISLQANKLYVLNMTVRIDDATQIIFACDSKNQAWMNADGTLSREPGQYFDARSNATEISDNVYKLEIYLPIENAANSISLLYRNCESMTLAADAATTKLVIDNVYLVENASETFLPASQATVSPANQEISSIQDISVTVANNYGTFVSVTENNAALTENDYVIDGNTLTIKDDYLTARGMAIGQTLTFTYNTVNPDDSSKTFATNFTVKLNATVWGSVYEKEFDGTNDVSFDVTIGETSGVIVKFGTTELTASDFAVSSSSVIVKASYLNTLESNKVHQFIMVDSSNNEFRFAIYVGCTAQSVFYANFEDGVLITNENIGVGMNPAINANGFDGKSTRVSGSGTLLLVNRPDYESNEVVLPLTTGETYEFSMDFKFAENGKPVAGAANDWGVLGGNKNVFLNFMNQGASSKFAWIEVDENGVLSIVKNACVVDKTSLTLNGDVYTIVLTFVANGNVFEVPCWNAATFDIDNIMVRKVPGIPTMTGSAYTFDKSTNADVNIPVAMHGSTFTEVKINDVALTTSEYTLDGGVLTLHAAKLATYETGAVLSVTVVSNAGVSAAVTVTVQDAAPFFTDGNVYAYGPDDPLKSIGLDAYGKEIKEVKTGGTVVPTTAWTYDASAKTFTFTESYLTSLEGTVEFTVSFEGTSVTLTFNVVSKILDTVLAMDFEDDVQAAPVGQLGTQLDGLATLSQSIVTDNGSKALKIVNVPEGLITIYSTVSSVKLDPTYLYMYQLDITVKAGVPVLFRYVETSETSRDFFWIQADGTLSKNGLNPKYNLVKTDIEGGYVRYEIMAFATPSLTNVSGNGNFEIATFASDTGAFDVTLDNFRIAKTSYPILMIDFEDDDYRTVLGDGLAMGATPEVYTGENSISGNNSLHYTANASTNLLLLRPGNAYIGTNLVAGTTYKLSFKIKISNFPTDVSQLQMPIFGAGGDIGYVRPAPNAAGEPYIEVPTGSGYVAGKTVIDADKDIYELSITWTHPTGKVELDFSVWGVVDMVLDDICIEVVR